MTEANTPTDATPPAVDDLLPIGDAARLLGVSVGTVRRWDTEGMIRSVRTPGGQRRFRRSEIDRLLADVA
jgi:excisionase family DNA binding protein